MNNFKVGRYERRGFQGIDASLDISLNEYGLIWKRDKKGNYHFVATWNDSSITRVLVHFWLNEKVNLEEEYSWVDWAAIAKFCGTTKKMFLELPFPMIISDLIGYYGIENFTSLY